MSKAKSPIKLFPREEFEDKVKALADGTVREYMEALLDIKSKTELDLLLVNANLDKLIESALSSKKTSIERLDAIWDLWTSVTAEYRFISFSTTAQTPIPEPTITQKVDDRISIALNDLVEAIENNKRIQSSVRDCGYKYLPTWPTIFFVNEVQKITEELGYDPFSDLEKYAESVDQILPCTEPNITYRHPSVAIKELLIESGVLIAGKFAETWNDCNQALLKKFDAEDDHRGPRGIASLGRLILTSNLLASIELVDEKLLPVYQDKIFEVLAKIKIEKVGSEQDETDAATENLSDELLGTIVKATTDFEALGTSKEVSKSLALCHMLVMLQAMFCKQKNYAEMAEEVSYLSQLCNLAPFLTTGLRQALADLVIDEGHEDDDVIDERVQTIAFCFQDFVKTENAQINEPCEIFDKLNFRRRGISKSEFLELANLYLFTNSIEQNELEKNLCAREFMAASQKLIGWFCTAQDHYATPRLIQSLSSLRNFGNFGTISISRYYDPNPVWALSKILLDEDDFIDEKREIFARQAMIVSEVLLNNGMISGASCVFNFLMVAESIRMAFDCNFINDKKPEINYIEPFGDWASFKKVVSRLMDSGKKEVTEKSIKFAIDYLRETGITSFSLAISELSAYITSLPEIAHPHRATEVIKLVQSKGNSIRERLIGLIGEANWDDLPSKIRGQVIQCEQVYDQSMGDQVLSGEPNFAWLTSYNTMIERMFKLKISEMWTDPSLSKDLDASYSAATKRNLPAPKFSLGSALYVCIGAAESGNRSVLNFLKNKGVDPHYVATKLSKDLFKAIKIRNKSTHAEEVSYEEASEARRVFLTRLPDVVKCLGIADVDY